MSPATTSACGMLTITSLRTTRATAGWSARQELQRIRCTALRAEFKEFTEQDKGDDRDRRVEVHIGLACARPEP